MNFKIVSDILKKNEPGDDNEIYNLRDMDYKMNMSLAFLLKAVMMTLSQANELLSKGMFGEDDETFKSVTIKLISDNGLIKNFDQCSPYIDDRLDKEIISHFPTSQLIPGREYTDKKRVKSIFQPMSGLEMQLIGTMKEILKGTELYEEVEFLNMNYTLEHLRYTCEHNGSQLPLYQIIDLQVLYKVCRDCEYDLKRAARLCVYFNKECNKKEFDAVTCIKNEAEVKNYLEDNAVSGPYVEEMKKKYCRFIRKIVKESMKDEKEDYPEAIDKLDEILGYRDLASLVDNISFNFQ